MSSDNQMYILIIEWDGCKPPTKWYRRLSELAGNNTGKAVRGNNDKSKTPMERRIGDDAQGLVMQEGCIICPSKSLLEYLAAYAQEEVGDYLVSRGGKRPEVSIGVLDLFKDWSPDASTRQIINRVSSQLRKRGRRPAPETWTTTCLECLETKSIKSSHVVKCPNCAGLRYHKRKGTVDYWKENENISAFDMWARTRFSRGHMETGLITYMGDKEAPEIEIDPINSKEADIYHKIISSNLVETINKMPRQHAWDVLDAIVLGRHYSQVARQEARVKAVTTYLTEFVKSGQVPEAVSIAEGQPDLLDCALLLGTKKAVDYAISYGIN